MSSPKAPPSQADFWDQEAFPGPRTTTAGTGGVTPFLEAGFMATGTPLDAIYPMDIDQAYANFDAIKPHVVKFWEAGAQPAQMLTDNEAVMAHSWNGRTHAIIQEGAPVAVVWNEAQLATDVWAIPKGAANAENAQKFAAFITLPDLAGPPQLPHSVRLGQQRLRRPDDAGATGKPADLAGLPGQHDDPRHCLVGG